MSNSRQSYNHPNPLATMVNPPARPLIADQPARTLPARQRARLGLPARLPAGARGGAVFQAARAPHAPSAVVFHDARKKNPINHDQAIGVRGQ